MANVKIKVFALGFAGALAVSAFAGSAMAAQPANPGCFGQDRAEWIHANFQMMALSTLRRARPTGLIAERAETNGAMNRAYKLGCGGVILLEFNSLAQGNLG